MIYINVQFSHFLSNDFVNSLMVLNFMLYDSAKTNDPFSFLAHQKVSTTSASWQFFQLDPWMKIGAKTITIFLFLMKVGMPQTAETSFCWLNDLNSTTFGFRLKWMYTCLLQTNTAQLYITLLWKFWHFWTVIGAYMYES